MIAMKRSLILFLLGVSLCAAFIDAQTVPVTAIIDNRSVDVEHTAKLLESKLNSALTDAGAHSESDRGLYLVGELTPITEDVVDTGMKKMVIRRYVLSLRIEQPMLDMRFGLLEIPLEASGADSMKASMEAARKFNPASSVVQNFIVGSMRKADNYFIDNIDNIIDKADMLAKSGDYDAGIALLWGCPNITSIHSKVYAALSRLYVCKQNKECANLLTKARSAYDMKNYEEAASYINEIDAESNCAQDASTLSKLIGQEIRQAEKEAQIRADKEKELQFQALENKNKRAYELERKRISAIENVATSYLNRSRSVYHYYVW